MGLNAILKVYVTLEVKENNSKPRNVYKCVNVCLITRIYSFASLTNKNKFQRTKISISPHGPTLLKPEFGCTPLPFREFPYAITSDSQSVDTAIGLTSFDSFLPLSTGISFPFPSFYPGNPQFPPPNIFLSVHVFFDRRFFTVVSVRISIFFPLSCINVPTT